MDAQHQRGTLQTKAACLGQPIKLEYGRHVEGRRRRRRRRQVPSFVRAQEQYH